MNRIIISKFALVMVLFAVALPGWAQSTKEEIQNLKEDMQTIKSSQVAIQRDLAEIKRLLQQGSRPAAPPEPAVTAFTEKEITIDTSPLLGDMSAVITLVEYSDFQCPYCARHYSTVMPELIKKYVDSGKVKYVMREFPLTAIHPRAMDASHAALCAQEQDKYWEMHNLIFENQKLMSIDNFKAHGQALGLEPASFAACLETKKYNTEIRENLAEGRDMGVRGTPSFVLGITDSDDPNKVTVTKFIRGAQAIGAFTQAIEELLASNEDSAAQE